MSQRKQIKKSVRIVEVVNKISTSAVADPGFPVGGRGPRRGARTPEAATFHKICMSKRKNWVP